MCSVVAYILRRNDLYLSELYDWGNTPNAFPEWHFQDVLDEAMNYPDPPLEVGEMVDGELDHVKWTKIDA